MGSIVVVIQKNGCKVSGRREGDVYRNEDKIDELVYQK